MSKVMTMIMDIDAMAMQVLIKGVKIINMEVHAIMTSKVANFFAQAGGLANIWNLMMIVMIVVIQVVMVLVMIVMIVVVMEVMVLVVFVRMTLSQLT